ncbi:unnamed protein product [Brassica oleracea var. botrytis]
MIHGPCGVFNQKSPCMENNSGYVLYHNTFVCSEVSFQVHNQGLLKQRNEIQDYIDARYVSACESMWRNFAFHIHKKSRQLRSLSFT